MKFIAILLSFSLLVAYASAIGGVKLFTENENVIDTRACYCIATWLGGTCIQWGGGPACVSGGKRSFDSERCLCLTWNSNGFCIFCKPDQPIS